MIGPQSEKPIFTFIYDDAARIVLLAFNEASGATGDLVHLQGDNYPGDAAEIGERYGRSIYNFLIVMQTWNPTNVLNMKRHAFEQFAKADLERAVKTERDRPYYRRAKGCPGCK